ncbi:DUF5642 family protein [Mycobacterium asiaticum]|uniref:DUF5642 domain-containing protein n=1 Tax=Mycobacterium asiaticum TaxID=1790 RepID=A0A1A3L0X2_MYCAS|nr:DUF5642 family protein [Mycobacterium asiaticum]OBJ89831.1 hypothetical protein A5640_26780 [Mycobacterium asiaticum]
MRPSRLGAALALLLAGCAQSPAPAPPSITQTSTQRGTAINPANIRRVGRDLPPGYEVSNVPRAASPRAIWGVGGDAGAVPPQCIALAEPATEPDPAAQGVSGSGPGGILDAVVVPVAAGSRPNRELVSACARWELSAGRTKVSIQSADAPRIDGAETIGMVADIRAAVESGSEIDSRAYTFVAYLGQYCAFTTLTTDPGSMLPPLPAQFAADLLVKTVSTLRG